jgi:ankyrin repeat protein
MLSMRLQLSVILIVFISFFFSGQTKAQIIEIQGEYYDTSLYIPSFYNHAISYNLMIASSKGYLAEIPRLIKRGADIDGESDNGVTPILFAVYNNQPLAVNILIKYGADLNKTTTDYESPLLVAAKYDFQEIAELLIRSGALINYSDAYDVTPLHYASIYGYLEMVDMLIYYDAEIDNKTVEGTTPLLAAVWAGNIEVADLLIQNGADINSPDIEGFTPFLMAAMNGDTLLMDLLIKNGADIYAVNNAGHNALTLAIMNGSKETTLYLLKTGNRWKSPENNKIDPYKVATKYRRKEIIPILQNNNVPGNVKLAIDQYSLGVSTKIVKHDIYTGVSISFKEPFINAGFILGVDTKIWATRVLIEQNEQLFYQYWDKSSIVYGGMFKVFDLSNNNFRSNSSITVSLSAGYKFVNSLNGSAVNMQEKISLIPSITFNHTWKRTSLFIGAEYNKSDYYKVGPVWLRVGGSWTSFFDNIRIYGKNIKWY